MANAICPKCGSEMKIRNGRRGEFWGCSKFPRCKGTKSIGGYSKKFKAEQKTSRNWLARSVRSRSASSANWSPASISRRCWTS